MRNPKEYLGRGWAFPFQFDAARGTVGYSEFEENIRQNITIILGTRPGERQMLPAFGCRIHEMLFTPNTRSTASLIAHYVEESLRRWEQRIEVVKVNSRPEGNGAIRVDVEYRVKATGQSQHLTHAVVNR